MPAKHAHAATHAAACAAKLTRLMHTHDVAHILGVAHIGPLAFCVHYLKPCQAKPSQAKPGMCLLTRLS